MSGQTAVDYYEEPSVVSRYVDLRPSGLTDRERRAVETYFAPGTSVLDVGCGAGRTTAALADRGFDVTGVDVSADMVEAAAAADDGLPYLVADATRLPFADASFDHVLFSYNGLDEVSPVGARNAALSEIHRVLEPGGVFAFSTHNVARKLVPYPPTADHLRDLARFWAGNARDGRLATPYKRPNGGGEPAVYFANPLTVRRRLARLGFEVLAFLENGGRASAYLGAALFVVARKRRRIADC